MPKRWRMPPEKLDSDFLRTSQRLVWASSDSTVSRRAPRPEMPFRIAMWSSMS
jgi:hypothetical protein